MLFEQHFQLKKFRYSVLILGCSFQFQNDLLPTNGITKNFDCNSCKRVKNVYLWNVVEKEDKSFHGIWFDITYEAISRVFYYSGSLVRNLIPKYFTMIF